jgi:tetratricopeptide (TPR) repeat protein
MAGHQESLLRLAASWRDACSGNRRTVLTIGEAGIGKSRHIRSLKQLAARERQTVIEVVCSEQQQASALSPFVALLNRRLPTASGAEVDRDKLADLRAELSRGGPVSEQQLQAVARLLSIETASGPPADPNPKRLQITLSAFLHWLGSFASQSPTLLVVEDLHWSDPSTLQLVQQLTAASDGNMLVAITARPEISDRWQIPANWEVIRLDRLSADDQNEIIGFIAGNRSLPREVHAQLVSRAAGVPLYLEEMTKSLLESGVLRLEGDGYILDGDLTPDVVPASIQDSLTARFDRLGPAKRLLQQLAVLGLDFSAPVLNAVVHLAPEALERQLQRLVDAQMLVRDEASPSMHFTFRHALIRDVAYQSLLRRAREQLHREIAVDLSRSFPDWRVTRPEFLAQHFAAGGQPREAIEHWMLAGQRAISGAAFVEGIGHFNHGLALIDGLPRSPERSQLEIGLLASLGLALITTRGFAAEDVASTFSRAADLCDELGNTPFRVIYGIWAVQLVRSDAEQCARLASHFRRIVERSGTDPLEQMAAHAALASWAYWQGDYSLAIEHAAAARDLCDRENPRKQHDRLLREFGVDCSLYGPVVLACCQLSTGMTAEARSTITDACQLAEVIDDQYASATVLSFAAAIHYELADLPRARAMAERVQTIAIAKEYYFWLAVASALLGRLLFVEGQRDAGLQSIGQGLGLLGQIGAKTSSFFYRTLMIESLIEADRAPEAVREADDALSAMETALDRQAEPELQRLRAAAHAACGDWSTARAALDRAIAVSRARGAHLYEDRAARAVERLLPSRGNDAPSGGLARRLDP